MKNHREFREAVEDFLSVFEQVFGADWECTKGNLGAEPASYMIAEDGTFLEPQVANESDNWGNRGALLATYRRLRQLVDEDAERPADGLIRLPRGW